MEEDEKPDSLDSVIRRIFEIVDTYYVDWQAKRIEKLIGEYVVGMSAKTEAKSTEPFLDYGTERQDGE